MDPGSYKTLRLKRERRLLRASFNRPASMNAIDKVAHLEVARFFAEVATDQLSDVAIVTADHRDAVRAMRAMREKRAARFSGQ